MPDIARVFLTQSFEVPEGRFTLRTNPIERYGKEQAALDTPVDFVASYFYSPYNNACAVVVTATKAVFNPDNLQALIDADYPGAVDMVEAVRWDFVLNQGQKNKFQGQIDALGIMADISGASTLGEAVNLVLLNFEPLSGGLTNFDPAWFDKLAGA